MVSEYSQFDAVSAPHQCILTLCVCVCVCVCVQGGNVKRIQRIMFIEFVWGTVGIETLVAVAVKRLAAGRHSYWCTYVRDNTSATSTHEPAPDTVQDTHCMQSSIAWRTSNVPRSCLFK